MKNAHGGLPADARVVIVGASLAGLRTAEALRDVGHDGPITVIGDEEQAPYDRPPLSKQVLLGFAPARKQRAFHDFATSTASSGCWASRRRVLIVPSGRFTSPTGDASTTTVW